MSAGDERLRSRLVDSARRMNAAGLNHGRSGNASVRVEAGFVITPTGMPYDSLEPGDLVLVAPDGRTEGARKPSSEWRMHRDIYARRPDVNGVIHTHSPNATALACLRRPIPAFHYEVAFAGGRDIRCAPYATFGTQALSDHALAALEGRNACLLANHGAVALGATLEEAFAMAEKLEVLARIYREALQIGEPVLLDDEEMDRVVERFRTYGRQ